MDVLIAAAVSASYVGVGVWIWTRLRRNTCQAWALGWTLFGLIGVLLSLALTLTGFEKASWRIIFAYDAVLLLWTIVTIYALCAWSKVLGSPTGRVRDDGDGINDRINGDE